MFCLQPGTQCDKQNKTKHFPVNQTLKALTIGSLPQQSGERWWPAGVLPVSPRRFERSRPPTSPWTFGRLQPASVYSDPGSSSVWKSSLFAIMTTQKHWHFVSIYSYLAWLCPFFGYFILPLHSNLEANIVLFTTLFTWMLHQRQSRIFLYEFMLSAFALKKTHILINWKILNAGFDNLPSQKSTQTSHQTQTFKNMYNLLLYPYIWNTSCP